MKRITILSLMGLILALAVSIAALRNADDYWAGGMMMATPLVLCVALIGSLCGKDRFRVRRLGFAILGGGYFALAFLGISEPNLARLPTSWLLLYVHQQVAPPQSFVWVGALATGLRRVPASANPVVSPNPWKSMLPGAENYETFRIVGHCLFALLAGLLGAAIAQWFRNRRERTAVEGQTA